MRNKFSFRLTRRTKELSGLRRQLNLSQNSHEWTMAMQEEFNSLMGNSILRRESEKSEGGKIIDNNKWIATIKRNPDGNIERYKARLVNGH